MRKTGGPGRSGGFGGNFASRLETQAAAKQALLEKAKAIAEKNREGAEERAAERKRLAEEREKRQAERAEQKRIEAERLAAEKAEAERRAKEEAERIAAEQKAKRDERYAKRKQKKR